MLPWSAVEIGRYPWYALPEPSGDLIAVMFVTASSTLFNTAGIEVALHRETNLERRAKRKQSGPRMEHWIASSLRSPQ